MFYLYSQPTNQPTKARAHTLLFGPPDEQYHHASLYDRPQRTPGLPGQGVPHLGWGPAEPGWASPLGKRCTGNDATSAPPRDQDQGKGKDKGKDTDFTGRGPVVGPSGPCTWRPATDPSGLYTRRGPPWRRLEDGEGATEQAASAVTGH